MSGEQIVYGARCVWWDSIDKAATTDTGLPVCPYCGSPLYVIDADQWWASINNHESGQGGRVVGHPGYRRFIEWLRGQCFSSYDVARHRYQDSEFA